MAAKELLTGEEIDTAEAAAFWRRVFSAQRSEFIIDHGDWLYRGRENQWFICSSGKIAAFCAVIPVDCALEGERVPALWWVDLIVEPAFRGQGLQRLFDQRVREAAGLLLGFPNELAAKIHRRHQWGVREDGDVLLLPLHPTRVKTVRQREGLGAVPLRLIAAGMLPVAWAWRRHLQRQDIGSAAPWPDATSATLAAVFDRYKSQYGATIYRDAAYWQWRYFDAPYRDELSFYRVGPAAAPTHCLVARHVRFGGVKAFRILDIMGDRNDLVGLRALLLLSLKEAITGQVAQVTALNFLPERRLIWQRLGFVLKTPGRFCWFSPDKSLKTRIGLDDHWVLGDSDLDAPE